MRTSLGVDFLRWQGHRQARVLYIDGEMSRRLLKQRLQDEIRRIGTMSDTFFALSREDLPHLEPLNTVEGQRMIEAVIREHCGGEIDLISFDNIMSLTDGEMKDEESWGAVTPWIRDLTGRSIGQLWVHHTGHDASRQYGTKTREWQLDLVAHMEKVDHDDTDVNFNLQFKKKRERTPDNWSDFDDMQVTLLSDKWKYVGSGGKTFKTNPSPVGRQFFDCAVEATIDIAQKTGQLLVTTMEAWRTVCIRRGLLHPEEKPDSARSLLSKHKVELIARRWIAVDGNEVTILK
jgi:hypothetical protein